MAVIATLLLALPAAARAAIPRRVFMPIPAGLFRLHADWSEDALATSLRRNVNRSGAPTLTTLMHDLDHHTGDCDDAELGALPRMPVDRYFCWDTTDARVSYWTPQGITGSSDGAIGGVLEGQTFTAVSWYYRGNSAGRHDPRPPSRPYATKGVRISFVNAAHTAYRSVLLVEPRSATSYAPVPIHAAGISLAGHYLYVTSLHAGLRVFDLDKMMTMHTGGSTVLGKSGSAWYAYGYRYVIPQVAAYTPVGPELEYSSLALDRSTSPDTLVVSEYSRDTGGRIVAFPVDASSRRLIAYGSVVTALSAARMPTMNVQGATSFDGVYVAGSSDGTNHANAYAGFAGRSARTYGWAIGGEDLYHQHSYDDGTAQPGLLWSLTEHAYCNWSGTACGTKQSNALLDERIVFAVTMRSMM